MTMREKMARALFAHTCAARERMGMSQPRVLTWEGCLGYADAALAALMEPTEDMLAATIPALTEPDTFDLDASPGHIPIAATLAWKAMITAAKEGK